MYSMFAQHSLLTVLTAAVLIVVARGEKEDNNALWQIYGVELPPAMESSKPINNLSPLILYAPASYPLTLQQVAGSVAYDAESQRRRRYRQPAVVVAEPSAAGRQKRMDYDLMMPEHRFLKRQFGRDSTSLRFGKRATAPTKSA